MNRFALLITVLCLALVPATGALAQATLYTLENYSVSSLSADGTEAAGFLLPNNYEVARWSIDMPDTAIGLGRTPDLFAGKADISADGEKISASIASIDTPRTWGVWEKGVGWTECMPPMFPDGKILDGNIGSAWGLSGDGLTVAGMYWSLAGRGQAGTWTAAGDLTKMESPESSRPNGIDHDGDVVVGWSYIPGLGGTRQPTVWDNGARTVLDTVIINCDAYDVSADGNTIVGQLVNEATQIRGGAFWTRNGGGWDAHYVGYLPGTQAGYGACRLESVSDDGNIIVGGNWFSGFTGHGVVWTPTYGLMKADDFVTDVLGVTLPDGYSIRWLTAVSGDGKTIAGWGTDPYDFSKPRMGFIINFAALSAVTEPPRASGLVMNGNRPNPFNPATSISLTVEKPGHVRLAIYNVRGQLVNVIHDGELAEGSHDIQWNGRDTAGQPVGSGVYLARATGPGGAVATQRMALVK